MWASSDTSTTPTIYYNSGSASNPGSDGHLYEYSSRNAAIDDDAGTSSTPTYITVKGISCRRNYGNNGSLDVGHNATLIDVEANEGTKHNALAGNGVNIDGLSMHNAWYGGQGSNMLILYANTGNGVGGTINALTALMDVYDTSVIPVYGHTGSGPQGTWAYTNFVVTNLAQSAGGPCSSIDGLVSTGSGEIQVTPALTSINNIVMTAMHLGSVGVGINAGSTVSISNSTIVCNAPTQSNCISVASGSPLRVSITNNNLSTNNGGYVIGINAINDVVSLTITGNTFQQGMSNEFITFLAAYDGSTPTVTPTINNNTYHYQSGGSRGVLWGPNFYSWFNGSGDWAAWQALGYDTSSTRVTP